VISLGRRARATIGPALLAVMASHAAAQPAAGIGDEVMRRVSHSVVQVRARDCGTGDRVGTGFVWPSADRVVTAMHLVTGCQQLALYHEGRRVERGASILTVTRESDLALLSVRGTVDWPSAVVATRRPSGQEDLAVLGYELGAPTMSSKSLKLSFGSSLLRDMIPDQVRRELQIVGFPSVDLEILRLEGHLLPGHSGAPIFDRDGKVVAVADGGLENGAASISWGLPVDLLQQLRASTQSPPAVSTQRVATLFAASLESKGHGAGQTCGSATFTKVRTRSFADIARTTDDLRGLQQQLQLLAFAGVPDMSSQIFDIHVDRESGATIVLPAGTGLQPNGPVCLAQSQSGRVRLYVRGDSVATLPHVQLASLNFEKLVSAATQLSYRVDPYWTYAAPGQRFDGLLVNRKSAFGYSVTQYMSGYLYETLMSRARTFIGVAAVNLATNEAFYQAVQLCKLQPQMLECGQLHEIAVEWAPFVLAIHMSTFPIG
jgi:S1-C subfamily serine protease